MFYVTNSLGNTVQTFNLGEESIINLNFCRFYVGVLCVCVCVFM